MQDLGNFSNHDSQIGRVSSSYVGRSRRVRNFLNLTTLILLALAGVLALAQSPKGSPAPFIDQEGISACDQLRASGDPR